MARLRQSSKAKHRGETKKRRHKREERRKRLFDLQQRHNEEMRAQGHPGWTTENQSWLRRIFD